jgi:hypothetical protein
VLRAARRQEDQLAVVAAGRALEQERMVLGWPKRCKLAHAFRWEYSYKRLKLAQLLGKLGVFLTWSRTRTTTTPRRSSFSTSRCSEQGLRLAQNDASWPTHFCGNTTLAAPPFHHPPHNHSTINLTTPPFIAHIKD